MGATNAPYVMTLANSIIGVSILAMPFCFKQCGVALASLILLMSSILTRLSCHYLLKSAIMSRRRSFEFLAFHSFGNTGKTVVELCIIFFMIGTCIAFFVVMGDLGPEIIGALINYNNLTALRPSVLIGLAVFVVLPLGMLRNVDSLSSICTASLVFYFCLVIKVFMESTGNLIVGDWMNDIHYWKPAGILQCLPIFSMALSCQSQLFEIFESVPGATLDRMNGIIKSAVNLCTALYISVGFFGYIAFYKQNLTGNILMSFSSSLSSDLVKIFFVLSVAVTFPLVIFPCRASMNSLLFRKAHVPHYELVSGGSGGVAGGGNHIPEARFKCITLFIITVPLTIGLLAPNIEIVLGLLGSTIGVVICILFPPLIFIQISSKATSERLCAQIVFAIGIFIMIMGTYANLYLASSSVDVRKEISIEKSENLIPAASIINNKIDSLNSLQVPPKESNNDKALPAGDDKKNIGLTDTKNNKPETAVESNLNGEADQRKEPPIPIAPDLPNISPPKESEDKKILQPQPINVVNGPSNDKSNDAINVKNDPSIESKKRENNEEPPNNPSKEKTIKIDNAVIDKPVNDVDEHNGVVAKAAKKEAIAFDNKKPSSTYENISALIKDSIPLPVAVNQSIISSGKNIVRSKDENVPEIQPRDILQKEPPLEREKRDLEYVTAHSQFLPVASMAETSNNAASNKWSPNNDLDGADNKMQSDSFVKTVAESDQDESCTKKERSDVRSLTNNSVASAPNPVSEKVKSIAKSAMKNAPSDEMDSKLTRIPKSKSSNTNSANGLAAIPGDILIPSKFSIPNIVDSSKNDVVSPINNRIGSVDIKPMKRELKSVDNEESSKT